MFRFAPEGFCPFLSTSISLVIQPVCPFLISLGLSQRLLASALVSVGWTMLIFLLLVSLRRRTSTLGFFLTRLLPECALLRLGAFDVNGNSWLREIWWKVSRPVFTASQMASKQAGGEDTNTLFSEGLNVEDCFGRHRCSFVVLGTFPSHTCTGQCDDQTEQD